MPRRSDNALEVNGQRMAGNLGITKGLIMSEAVMMALAPKMGRGLAHDLLYKVCRQALAEGKPLADMLKADKDIAARLDATSIDRLTDPTLYLGVAGEMIDAVIAQAAEDRA